MRDKRMIWGGRAPVRSALYLSVWSASKWNPVILVFYQRLRANGKPPKVAQVACMRKLLTIGVYFIPPVEAGCAATPLRSALRSASTGERHRT
jgi:hypothetical protein